MGISEITELCITVSKSKASLAALQGWGALSHRTTPCEMICTNAWHQKRRRDKDQPQRAEVECQLAGTSAEEIDLAKTKGNVWVLLPLTPEGLLGGWERKNLLC